MNEVVQMHARQPATSGGSLIPQNMQDAMRLAEMMATCKLVPKELQRSPGDCLLVIEQAMRWGMSPFAVAQCTSVIQGKLMFEGKLVAAAVETSGAIHGLFQYEFTGKGDALELTVSATRTGESAPKSITVSLKNAKTANALWGKQPEQQLVYFGTRAWARRWTPAVMLGVYSPEEVDALPQPAPRSTEAPLRLTSEATKQTTAQAIGDEIPERIMDAPPAPERKRTFREYLRDKLAACFTLDDLRRLETEDVHITSKLAAGNGAAIEIQAALKARAEQLSPTQADNDDLGSGMDDAPLPNDPVPDMAPGA